VLEHPASKTPTIAKVAAATSRTRDMKLSVWFRN
jgi:hypothetical protein